MTTTTIRLEDALKARIAAAAGLAGKTTHAFILLPPALILVGTSAVAIVNSSSGALHEVMLRCTGMWPN
jgi:hypothetical protein